MATKCTKEQAEELCSKIKTLFKSQHKELQIKLGEAFLRKAHEALGLNSFEDFLEKCKSEGIEFSNSHMRRVAQAAAFEIMKNGMQTVGEIRAGTLRPLFENVDEEHRDEVYEDALRLAKAKKNKRNLTANYIIKAAKKLGFYKIQKSKTKKQKVEVTGSRITARKKVSKADADVNYKPSKSEVPDIANNNVDKVKTHVLPPEKLLKRLTKKYDVVKLRSIRDYLQLHQKRQPKLVCEKIMAENDESNLKKLVDLLTSYITKN